MSQYLEHQGQTGYLKTSKMKMKHWEIFLTLLKQVQRKKYKYYCISLKNGWGWLFIFFAPKGGDYSREGDYIIQILLTRSHARNILFYVPIKSKDNHIK